MQPFIPVRLKKSLRFLRPWVPGGPVHGLVPLPAAALAPLFDASFDLASALRAQGDEYYPFEVPGAIHGGSPRGDEPVLKDAA